MSKQLQSDISEIQSLIGLSQDGRQALMDAAIAREIERKNSMESNRADTSEQLSLRCKTEYGVEGGALSNKNPGIQGSLATDCPTKQSIVSQVRADKETARQPPGTTTNEGQDAKQHRQTKKAQASHAALKSDARAAIFQKRRKVDPASPDTPSQVPAAKAGGSKANRCYTNSEFRFASFKAAVDYMRDPSSRNSGRWIKPSKSGKFDRRFLCGQPGHLEAGCRVAALIHPVMRGAPALQEDGSMKDHPAYFEVRYSTDEHKFPAPEGLVSTSLPTTGLVAVDTGAESSYGSGGTKVVSIVSAPVASMDGCEEAVISDLWTYVDHLLMKQHPPSEVEKLVQQMRNKHDHLKNARVPTLPEIESRLLSSTVSKSTIASSSSTD